MAVSKLVLPAYHQLMESDDVFHSANTPDNNPVPQPPPPLYAIIAKRFEEIQKNQKLAGMKAEFFDLINDLRAVQSKLRTPPGSIHFDNIGEEMWHVADYEETKDAEQKLMRKYWGDKVWARKCSEKKYREENGEEELG